MKYSPIFFSVFCAVFGVASVALLTGSAQYPPAVALAWVGGFAGIAIELALLYREKWEASRQMMGESRLQKKEGE